MKTAELTGAWLDYWVGKAVADQEDATLNHGRAPAYWAVRFEEYLGFCAEEEEVFEPSTVWKHGGPIIDAQQISVVNAASNLWNAGWQRTGPYSLAVFEAPSGSGPTALIAAMRAYVASKFGEEVPDA